MFFNHNLFINQTLTEMNTKKSTTANASQDADLNSNPLGAAVPTTEELEKVKESKSKGKAKTEKKEKEPKEPKVTKKSVVIRMISTKKGALIVDIAQEIVTQGIDADLEKNIRVVKLWLSKIGFKVEKDEKTNCYRKAS